MSKMYEALTRGDNETAELLRKMVGNPEDLESADAAALGAATPGLSSEAPSVPAASGYNGNGNNSGALQKEQAKEVAPAEPIRRISLPPICPIVVHDDMHSRAAEQFRMIRTKVSQHPRKPQAITISSGNPGDGKSFTAMNLAAALALKEDARVVLVEGDMRRSSIAGALQLPEGPGLSEVLRGTTKLRSALLQVEEIPHLYLLPAGTRVSNPVELLDSPYWGQLLQSLRANFRFIIVDAPPVAAVSDYEVIQQGCDGVILVVRQDHSNRAAFQQALTAVGPERRLGVVLNSAQDDWLLRHAGQYYYYGGYGYGGYSKYYSRDKKKKSE